MPGPWHPARVFYIRPPGAFKLDHLQSTKPISEKYISPLPHATCSISLFQHAEKPSVATEKEEGEIDIEYIQEKGNAATGLLTKWKFILQKLVSWTANDPIRMPQGHIPLAAIQYWGTLWSVHFTVCRKGELLHLAC